MRLTVARTILGMTFFAAGLALAAPALGQTLLKPGDAGDAAAKAPQKMQEIEDAVGFFQKGDIESAEKSMAEAAKKNPDLPPMEVLMSQLCYQFKLGPLMLNYLEKAVQKNPDDPEAYLQLGEFDLQQRRVAAADLLFTKAALLMKTFNKSADRKAKLMPRVYKDLASISEIREDWPVAQQRLDDAQLRAVLQQMSGEAVP